METQRADHNHQQGLRLTRIAVRGAISVIALWGIAGFALYWLPERGTFGDMFGAVNTLFSGLAFLGIILTIVLQYEELKEQRSEIRQSRIAHEQSANALSAQLRHAEIRSRVESLNLLIEAQLRIIQRLDRTSVPQIQQRQELLARIARYESMLQELLDKEINRHDSTQS